MTIGYPASAVATLVRAAVFRFHAHLLLVACALCAAFGAPIRAHSAIDQFAHPNEVSFTISTDRKAYSAQEEITVRYRILNISNHALYAPRTIRSGTCGIFRHVWAWLEDGVGRRTLLSEAGSCPRNLPDPGSTPTPIVSTLIEWMGQEAVLLKPDERVDGTMSLLARELPPGDYRIEAILSGWSDDRFTDAERADLPKMRNPLLRGEVSASMRVALTP